jgi:SecD/SecF fusion protein
MCSLALAGLSLASCGSSDPPQAEAHPTAVRLIYRAHSTAMAQVDRASLDHAVEVMRRRVEGLGVVPVSIRVEGAHQITVELPDTGNVRSVQEIVGQGAQLYFYDWEPNVIGPSGKPEPTNTAATCGPEAAAARCGLPEFKAVQLAAKRPAIIRSNNTTYQPGCTPAQVNGCIYGAWYLIDTKHEKMLCANGKTICGPANMQAELYANGYKTPAGATAQAVHVNPGTVLVQARPEESNHRIVNGSPNSFYVLNDNPALSGKGIDDPRQGSFNPQQGLLNYGEGTGPSDVTFGFTAQGKTAFERMTKEIAQRGIEAWVPGVSKEDAQQHYAIVLDEQVISAPSVDYTQYPEGIDATYGSQITGNFTLASARKLADELRSGSLPIKLELISSSRVSAGRAKALP